ncbi:NAC domain-containing protein 86-like [Spinacia oleracea]|uniref:NAC domain-containing protein 86-like n=1 Tax=Spinacia oleracea TaxID=3562 RepID=A0ABM3R3S1_SPIOL|nr:NAC domain-containing protein 86-like [Spinacia oleracea]
MVLEEGSPNSIFSVRSNHRNGGSQILCHHGYLARLQRCKHTKNIGRGFYSCPVWKQDYFFRYPGFRFKPTDKELFGYYLKRKVTGQSARGHTIPQLDVYKYVPGDLPRLSGSESKDSIWYFLTPNNTKYPTAERSMRPAKGGGWKIKGKDTIVYSGSRRVGYVKKSIYFTNKVTKSDWVMLEYKLMISSPRMVYLNNLTCLTKSFKLVTTGRTLKVGTGDPSRRKTGKAKKKIKFP